MNEDKITTLDTLKLQGRKFIIDRVFDALPEVVFEAFINADALTQWWGPKDFKTTVHKLDVKPGGIFHYSLESPDGTVLWGKFVYHEIVASGKLVFVNSFSDENGNIARAPFSSTWPLEITNTLTLSEHGCLDGKTKFVLVGKPVNATEEEIKTFDDNVDSILQGFRGTLNKLDAYLAML